MRKPIYCIFSMHPAPYRDPMHTELLKSSDVEILIANINSLDKGHQEWKLTNIVSNAIIFLASNGDTSRFSIAIRAIKLVTERRFDGVVVPGYANLVSQSIILACIICRIPYIIDIDSSRSGTSNPILRYIKRKILSCSKGLWVPGEAAKKYFSEISTRPIRCGSYCLDGPLIKMEYARKRLQKDQILEIYGVPTGVPVFLSIAKLTPNRNVPALIKAFGSLKSKNAHLILIGYGPDIAEVRREMIGCEDRITHIESVKFADLIDFYSVADFYIHAGHEPYSTACEYAAHCGVPVICGRGVGYWHDLNVLRASFDLPDKPTAAELTRTIESVLRLEFDYGLARQLAMMTADSRSPQIAAVNLLELLDDRRRSRFI